MKNNDCDTEYVIQTFEKMYLGLNNMLPCKTEFRKYVYVVSLRTSYIPSTKEQFFVP